MKEKETMNTIETKAKSIVGSLVMICPVCGKEFVCNKAHHVYTALIKRNATIIAGTPALRIDRELSSI